MQDCPLTHPGTAPSVQQPHTVRVREEAAMRDAELRRFHGNPARERPPRAGELGLKEGGAQGVRKAHGKRQRACWAQRGMERQPCSGQVLQSPDRAACERLRGGLAGRAAGREGGFTAKTQSRL